MATISLDIKKVEIPAEVKRSILAFAIHEECSRLAMKRPVEMDAFFRDVDMEAGHDWMQELMKAATEMPIHLLQEWVDKMPSSMYRAEMRAELKRRTSA